MSADETTYLACLTPAGTGAIATLALRGPGAWALVREVFQPGSPRVKAGSGSSLPSVPEVGRLWLGRLGDESRGGADEVVLSVKRVVPTPCLEIHCHGGREVIRLLEEVFRARGVEVCAWQELEKRTAPDPAQACALAALAEAPTARTAAILLDQYHGAFARSLAEARAALERKDAAQAERLLDELARYAALGRHLTSPWRVVIAGAPNVGKSSLVNALVGYERSAVTPVPGTTRDVVTSQIAVAGWPVELSDTAGWREAITPLEQQGIALARQAAARADLCVWLLDGSANPVWPETVGVPIHLVINKIDLSPAWDHDKARNADRVSALTGAGMGELLESLANRLVPAAPSPGAAVPFTPRLADRMETARQTWHAGQAGVALRILASAWAERS